MLKACISSQVAGRARRDTLTSTASLEAMSLQAISFHHLSVSPNWSSSESSANGVHAYFRSSLSQWYEQTHKTSCNKEPTTSSKNREELSRRLNKVWRIVCFYDEAQIWSNRKYHIKGDVSQTRVVPVKGRMTDWYGCNFVRGVLVDHEILVKWLFFSRALKMLIKNKKWEDELKT